MDDMIKQAKQKALSLLNYMDRTESQLRKKLKEADATIEVKAVYGFGYKLVVQ